MRLLTFARRNAREILRDPLNLFFGLCFPLVLLLLLSAIQANVPVSVFSIEQLTPGITVFGLSFMTLFSATVIARDRGSALLQRLYTTPLTPADFILGYTLPLLPIAVAQCAVCYLAAMALGLTPTVHILGAVACILPVAILEIALGLLCGSLLTDRQVGGAFERVAYVLPFAHAVDMERAVLAGQYADALPHAAWVCAYAAVTLAAAVLAFLGQMRRQ